MINHNSIDLCSLSNRVLKLNAVPNSLCFCSQRGDLLVGIGDHVHRIDHKDCELDHNNLYLHVLECMLLLFTLLFFFIIGNFRDRGNTLNKYVPIYKQCPISVLLTKGATLKLVFLYTTYAIAWREIIDDVFL